MAHPLTHPEPQPMLELTPDRVSSSDAYGERFAGPAGEYLLGVQTQGLLKLLEPLGPGLRILDVGGGHAQSALPLAKAGHKVTILNSAIEYEFRARRACEGLDVEFISGPLHAPPVEPGSFDVVVALRMVMHMPDWRAFLKAMCETCGRGVLIDYPSWRSCNIVEPLLFGMKQRVEHGTARKYELFWPSELRRAFEDNGMRVTRSYAQCVLPLAVHRAVGSPAITGGVERVARGIGLTGLLGSPVLAFAEKQ